MVAAALPDPATLGDRMRGKTCAGTLVTGKRKGGSHGAVYLYHVSDNEQTMREYGHQAVVLQTARATPARPNRSGKASLRIRRRVAAEAAVLERDGPDRGDAVRTRRTVGGSGADDNDREEGCEQDESKQLRHPVVSHHRRPPWRSTPP